MPCPRVDNLLDEGSVADPVGPGVDVEADSESATAAGLPVKDRRPLESLLAGDASGAAAEAEVGAVTSSVSSVAVGTSSSSASPDSVLVARPPACIIGDIA